MMRIEYTGKGTKLDWNACVWYMYTQMHTYIQMYLMFS